MFGIPKTKINEGEMSRNQLAAFCSCIQKNLKACGFRIEKCLERTTPLSKACRCERLKICGIGGDRKHCARMAQLGVLPGSEIELLCPLQSQNCMIKVNGSTVSLDQMSADNILVTPV